MGTITMSGFNKIDWNAILDAVMTQERQPLTTMQTQRTALQSKATAFGTLATRLSGLDSAAADLADVSSLAGRTATSSDTSVVAATASSTAVAGAYDVVVSKLARAQVTTLGGGLDTPLLDKNETAVATGGNLTFLDAEGVQVAQVTLTEGTSYTLQQLADAINSTSNVPARATIVQAEGKYQLVLTGSSTGAANAFTVEDHLTGGPALVQANAMGASDADITVNNVRVTSASNVISDAIEGVTLSLLKEGGTDPVAVTVAEDPDVTKSKLEAFVNAFNGLIDFANTQGANARKGDSGAIGNDPLLRSLRGSLTGIINRAYPGSGSFSYLSHIGLEFERSGGKLKLNTTVFGDAIKNHRADVERLLAGDGTTDGAFAGIQSLIEDYSDSGGMVPDAKTRLEAQVKRLDDRMAALEERLAIRQKALQAEYSAADQIISQLNSQGSTLSSLGGAYSAF